MLPIGFSSPTFGSGSQKPDTSTGFPKPASVPSQPNASIVPSKTDTRPPQKFSLLGSLRAAAEKWEKQDEEKANSGGERNAIMVADQNNRHAAAAKTLALRAKKAGKK